MIFTEKQLKLIKLFHIMIPIIFILKKKLYFYAIFYQLERTSIPLNKNNYQRELNIIYDTAHKNNFNLNTIKKIHKRVQQIIK